MCFTKSADMQKKNKYLLTLKSTHILEMSKLGNVKLSFAPNEYREPEAFSILGLSYFLLYYGATLVKMRAPPHPV